VSGPPLLTVELHCHTEASEDCLVRPKDLARVCRARGLARVAVTDHNTLLGARAAQALDPDLIIVGEEIMTTQGELLAFFVAEAVPAGLSPAEAVARLRAQGAAISVSHPFDRLRRGAWREADLAALLPLVDAVEVFNARCVYPEDNARALAFAREHSTLGSVGSDAHSLPEYGRAVHQMRRAASPADLVAGWRDGGTVTRPSSPAVHLASRWAKTWKTVTGRLPVRHAK
jgi:predicted metal-dependent phosphoesterase TrpH